MRGRGRDGPELPGVPKALRGGSGGPGPQAGQQAEPPAGGVTARPLRPPRAAHRRPPRAAAPSPEDGTAGLIPRGTPIGSLPSGG